MCFHPSTDLQMRWVAVAVVLQTGTIRGNRTSGISLIWSCLGRNWWGSGWLVPQCIMMRDILLRPSNPAPYLATSFMRLWGESGRKKGMAVSTITVVIVVQRIRSSKNDSFFHSGVPPRYMSIPYRHIQSDSIYWRLCADCIPRKEASRMSMFQDMTETIIQDANFLCP